MNIFLIISIASLLFCVFFFLYFKWYIKRRISTEELLGEHRTEVYRLIAEIDSVTDRDSRLVEDRINQLKAILEDTDKRIAVYVRELERSRQGEALYTSLGRGIRAALKTPDTQASLTQESSQQAAQLAQVAQASSQLTQASLTKPQSVQAAQPPHTEHPPQAERPPQQSKAAQHETPKQIRALVEALANEGLSPGEIASRLGISLSEVDLAMNLRRR